MGKIWKIIDNNNIFPLLHGDIDVRFGSTQFFSSSSQTSDIFGEEKGMLCKMEIVVHADIYVLLQFDGYPDICTPDNILELPPP